MDPYLEALMPLAVLDDRLAVISDRLRHQGRKRTALDQAVADATARVAAADARLAELRQDELKHSNEIRRLEGLRDSARNALAQGMGSAEAAERQIERCVALLDEHETAVLEDLEARDTAHAERKGAAATLEEARARLAAEAPAFDAELARLREEQEALQIDRGSRVRSLPKDVQTTYVGLHATRGTALSAMAGDTCSACQHVVPMGRRTDLRQGRLVTCDGCGRWLYLPSHVA